MALSIPKEIIRQHFMDQLKVFGYQTGWQENMIQLLLLFMILASFLLDVPRVFDNGSIEHLVCKTQDLIEFVVEKLSLKSVLLVETAFTAYAVA